MRPPPPPSTLFPYTTLFRSRILDQLQDIPGITLGIDPDPSGNPFSRARRAGAVSLLLPQPLRDGAAVRSEEHTSELQSLTNLVCRLLLEKKKKNNKN